MLPHSEACERNKEPILAVLQGAFAKQSHVLEIGSGTGQHAVHFAGKLSHLIWQPSEQLKYLPDLVLRIKLQGGENLRAPVMLDVNQSVWPVRSVDAVFTANTLHIMSWLEVTVMYRGISEVLLPGGVMCVYGPFRYQDRYTSDSNRDFDRMLKERDPLSGLREIDAVSAEAAQYGLRLHADHDLPANNRLLQFIKD
jgi:SAM-dependent methyltransferase